MRSDKSGPRCAIEELFDLLEEAGCNVTLYGKSTTRQEVKRVARAQAAERLGGAALRIDEGEPPR